VLDASGDTLKRDSHGGAIEGSNRATLDLTTQDGHLVLADGQILVLQNYYSPGAAGGKNLFLSDDGQFVEVVLENKAEGALFASYEPLDVSGKWSAYDDMVFLDIDRIEPVIAPLLAAPLFGGLGAGAAAAGVVGAAALVAGGGYAEYCVAPALQCLPVPKGYSMIEAAAVPETYFTVWTNVFDRGRLKPGEVFLVHGGTSGIGTTAIQLARQFEARVFATAGSDDKCRVCEDLGAERGINYKTEDFAKILKDSCGGADLILDMVGAPYLERNLDALRTEGRLVIIAVLGGAKAEMFIPTLMMKRLTVTASTLRPRSVLQKALIGRDLYREVWPLLDARKVQPLIHETMKLEDAAKAHALMESSTHIGKIMLEI